MNKHCTICKSELTGKQTKFCRYLCVKIDHDSKGRNQHLENTRQHSMWKWYWEVKFKNMYLHKGMKKIWEYYDYKMRTETFTNTRS